MLPLFATLVLAGPYFVVAQFGGPARSKCPRASGGYPAWTCKRLDSCEPAQRLIKEDLKLPPVNRRCGFMDSEPLVCCPPFDIADWNSTVPFTKKNTPAPNSFSPPTKIPTAASPPTNVSPKNPSKAAAKCEEYSKLIYQDDPFEPLTTSSNKPKQKINLCDTDIHITVTGGFDAKPKEYPHMALLGYGDAPYYQCGGSLISEKFVLSAAHCDLHPVYGAVHTVLLGELNLQSDTDDATPQTFKVTRRIVHDDYAPTSNYNDIMLLELEKIVTFSIYIRPICLHTSRQIPTKEAIVTGWGRLEEVGPVSPILQKLELPLVSDAFCNKAYKKNFGTEELKLGILDDTQICAGGRKDQDACRGDSGGPLQISLGNCIFSQIGIVSFGRICGTEDVPGVYTRVSGYIPWIENNVWP